MDLLALEFGNDELDAAVDPAVDGRSSGAYSGPRPMSSREAIATSRTKNA